MTIERRLEVLGLSNTEARLYLSGLRNGPGTVQELSVVSGIKRTTVYAALERLKSLGLIKLVEEGRITKFHVEHPDKLSDLLTDARKTLIERETLLQHLLPELRSLVQEGTDPIHVQLCGQADEIHKVLFDRFLEEDGLFVLGSDELLTRYVGDLAFLEKFFLLRAQRRLETNILTDAVPSSLTLPSSFTLRQTSSQLAFTSILIFSSRRFLQIHLNAKITGLYIENTDFMDLLSFFFQFLWAASGPKKA